MGPSIGKSRRRQRRLMPAWESVKEALADFIDDQAPRLAAALAYYSVFSLAPMLLVVISIAGLVWGREAVRGEIVSQFSGLVGTDGGQLIQNMIENASTPATSAVSLVIGLATLLFGAAGTFVQLKSALNTVWEVKPKPMKSWRGLWLKLRTYLLSFAMLLVLAFLLIVTLVASAALAALGRWLTGALPVPELLLHAVDFMVSMAVITVIFAAIFKLLPDAEIHWRDVWLGAAVTALLFTAGKLALGLYLGRSSVTSIYGAAGSIVVILLWVYYASLIVLLGAEFTQVCARRRGAAIAPSEIAQTDS